MSSPTRRDALIAIAGVAAASAAPYTPRTLTHSEMQTVAALCDAIIPRTDTPGAIDAGVPEFIDRRLTASADLATAFRRGLSSLKPGASIEEIADTPFFKLLKDLTIDGYYSSREGLVEELGWHGNTFLTEFKGCTHPEHQA